MIGITNGSFGASLWASNGRNSVAGKLRNAFIGVSLFSLLAATVGIASYAIIDDAQDEVLDRSVPAVLAAEQMAKRGLYIIAKTPVLLASKNTEQVKRETTQIQSEKNEIGGLINELRRLEIAEPLVGRIEAVLHQVFTNLKRQGELVNERNRLRTEIDRLAANVLASTRNIIDALKPSAIEASAKLLAKSDEIRSALLDTKFDRDQTLAVFEELTDVDFFLVESLTTMRVRAESLVSHIDQLLLAVDQAGVASLRDELNIDLRSLARSALEVHDPSLRKVVGESLVKLTHEVQGPDNLLQLKINLFNIDDLLDQLNVKNRHLGGQLKNRVEELLSEVSSLIHGSTERARWTLGLGRVVLICIAIAAFLAAAYLTWTYVLKDVAGRIQRLADITRNLAGGDLGVIVDVDGSDEIGDMADAVRVFKANATELENSNAELEQFAYVASHDLKAPLRGIANLASWIESDLKDVMDSDTKHHIMLLHNRVNRMEALLEDLLQYSRIGRARTEIRVADLNDVVPEIFTLVATRGQFSLEVQNPLPNLVTACAPLEQVFRNLFSNAIKHHDLDNGCVKVDVRDLGDLYEFLIRDDGPGIPTEYHERVFKMFLTLRGRDEIEGSGMGLAIVRKIIESAGGTITLESDPSVERGTTFRFTWPKQWGNAGPIEQAA